MRTVALVWTPRLRLFLWAGSWSWVHRVPCSCRNVYVGPFGIELGRH